MHKQNVRCKRLQPCGQIQRNFTYIN